LLGHYHQLFFPPTEKVLFKIDVSILFDWILTIMGGCASTAQLIEKADGNEEAYHQRFLEDKVLGEGAFGVVKLVHDISPGGKDKEPLASKALRKGVQFKDNTLYSPLKPEILRGECEILQTLAGQHHCLLLVAIYETPRILYMVTELCAGGEMMQYVAKQDELRTEDVSRIAFQLLDAVNHCALHGVLHRDIKPENVMVRTNTDNHHTFLYSVLDCTVCSLQIPLAFN
jgi:serine/threonine protein kinase